MLGGGSLWALSLLRLQMSLLYFWAGEFKAKISWVQGSTLYRDVAILDTSPLKSLWHLIFWTEPIRRSVTTVLACAALALELTLPFLLWSDSVTTHILELFNAVNRTPKARACTSTPWPSQPPCISE